MDTGILVKDEIFLLIFEGINFRDMGIQCFLNFGDICRIYFRDMEYLSK